MPIYELQCTKCNRVGEYLVFGTIEGEQCMYCGNTELEKLMSLFGFKSGQKTRHAGNSCCSGCSKGNCSSCA